MSEGHAHDHKLLARAENKGKLLTVLFLTLGLMLAEVAVGLSANSLALLADAGHMMSDVGGLILALIAIWFSARPANERKTFGYYRSEILAGFINSIALVGIAIFILFEAWQRLTSPPEVNTLPVLILALIGIVINIISLKILSSGSESSLNIKAAYLEILADMLGLFAVVLSSLVIMFTGWHQADPLLSGLIAIMILPRTWMLLSECTHILMEGTPSHINLSDMYTAISAIDGVTDIHDLHVWTLTSDHHAMAAHVTVDNENVQQAVLGEIKHLLLDKFEIHHSTIQMEVDKHDLGKEDICRS